MRKFNSLLRTVPGVLLGCFALPGLAWCAGASDVNDLANIHVPEGFVIEKVAGPPLVERPIMAGFDERGRLFVGDSAGLNLKDTDLLKDPPHKIRMLEDTDGDGKFDKSTLFADKMVFPQGALWYDGALYVCSPPSLWKLEDTDGDGVADKRTEIVKGFGFNGNAADIHGPFLGPDGWLYWCDGRHGHKISLPDGSVMEGKAAGIFRCTPDGSRVEKVCGGGMDNPVEIAFTALGEPIVSCNLFLHSPKRVDTLFYGIDGGVYPWNEVFSEFKQTGDLLPPITELGWVAVSGIMRYRGEAFGPQYKDNFFTAQFNPHRVERHILERQGAGFRARNEDFLTCANTDFHPTDVLEDADGSLLVVDTGGWFRAGCPASQIAKPQITGGIYRIRRKDAPKVVDAWGLKLKWEGVEPEELIRRLSDNRPAVVDRAISVLGKCVGKAAPALERVLRSEPGPAAVNAVWAVSRSHDASASGLLSLALANKDPAVRLVATKALGMNADTVGLKALIDSTPHASPAQAREAALALGRMGKSEAVPAVLGALRVGDAEHPSYDRFLEHAVIYALIQIHDVAAIRQGLADADPHTRRGALIALDQTQGGDLTAQAVLPLLDRATPGFDPALQQAAQWVVSHHAEWAEAMLDVFKKEFAAGSAEKQPGALQQQLVAFCRDERVQRLVAEVLHDAKTTPATRLMLLEAIAESPLDCLPDAWAEELKRALVDADDSVARQALIAIRSGPQGPSPAVQRVESRPGLPDNKDFVGGAKIRDNFTVRWSGVLRLPQASGGAFSVQSSGPWRLYVGGGLLAEKESVGTGTPVPAEISLSAGDHDLRLEAAYGAGAHGCRLWWTSGGKKEVLPVNLLGHREPGKDDLSPGVVTKYYMAGPYDGRFPHLDVGDFAAPLLLVGRDESRPRDLRAAAIALVAPHMPVLDAPLYHFLIGCLGKDQPSLLRTTAADSLGRAPLNEQQLIALTAAVAEAGPMEAPKLLAAFDRPAGAGVGRQLISALAKSPGGRSLRLDMLHQVLGHYPSDVQKAAEPLLQQLTADTQKQKAHLTELQPVLTGGDAARGQALFFGNKANCAACHAVNNTGGRVGPDFSHIGAIRSGNDLLESIVYPSNSFVRGFEPYLVKTKDGDILDGIISHETADAVYLYNSQKIETRLARSAIAEIKPSPVSIMPEGFDTQLSRQELGDLIAFLQSLR